MCSPLISVKMLLDNIVYGIGKGSLPFFRADGRRRYQQLIMVFGVFRQGVFEMDRIVLLLPSPGAALSTSYDWRCIRTRRHELSACRLTHGKSH